MVALVAATGYATRFVDDNSTLGELLTVHRSLGACVWTVAALRLLWRQTFAHLPPFPLHMPKVQQWTAKASEYAMYVLLLAQPATGLADTLFRGHPFALFESTIPALFPRLPAVFKLAHTAHEYGAVALLGLIGLHATAALFHHFVLRDDVLQAMLPWRIRARIRRQLGATTTR